MLPIAGGGKFISIGDKIRFPDDVTMGFIIGEFVRSAPKWPWTYIYIILYTEHLLKVPLTVVDNFHSHLEPMEFIRQDTFQDQVSFSYAHMKNQWNVIKVDGFDMKTDPKRFYSLHCQLFPYFSFCPPRWTGWSRSEVPGDPIWLLQAHVCTGSVVNRWGRRQNQISPLWFNIKFMVYEQRKVLCIYVCSNTLDRCAS